MVCAMLAASRPAAEDYSANSPSHDSWQCALLYRLRAYHPFRIGNVGCWQKELDYMATLWPNPVLCGVWGESGEIERHERHERHERQLSRRLDGLVE